MSDLFNRELNVVNIGLKSFKETLDQVNVKSVHVDFRPPVDIDSKYVDIIAKNYKKIEKANKIALSKILESHPVLVGMDVAINVIPEMKKNMILHSGPPVTWEKMCGPMKGGVMAALMYEGMAKDTKEAIKLAASGEIEFSPCHEHDTVGPMAGIVSSSMPVFIIKNRTFKNIAFCTMNEGLGKVLRYGAYDKPVIEKLKWMENILYPYLKKAIAKCGEVDLKNIIAQALHMGDEVHNRNRAATSLFYRAIAPSVVEIGEDKALISDVLNFINNNDHFFLNLSMPACKATLDAARGVEGSSILTVMSRNGTEFGVQLAGTNGEWFVGEAEVPDALYFPGFTKDDANPDIGDSSITETAGLGGFAIAASPAIVQFVGGSSADACEYTLTMYEISAGENNVYQIPYLDFRGTPTGIDVRKVIEKNILPFIDTGVAHKDPGVGQVGAGVLTAPMTPFKKAYIGLAKRCQETSSVNSELKK